MQMRRLRHQTVKLVRAGGVLAFLCGCMGAQAAGPNQDWEADETLRLKLVFNLDPNEALRSVVEAEGMLWIGSDKGLYTYQRGSEGARKVFPAAGFDVISIKNTPGRRK